MVHPITPSMCSSRKYIPPQKKKHKGLLGVLRYLHKITWNVPTCAWRTFWRKNQRYRRWKSKRKEILGCPWKFVYSLKNGTYNLRVLICGWNNPFTTASIAVPNAGPLTNTVGEHCWQQNPDMTWTTKYCEWFMTGSLQWLAIIPIGIG